MQSSSGHRPQTTSVDLDPRHYRRVLSVVVPVYRGAECLGELHRRLAHVLDQLVGPAGWELILVDDRSPDEAWQVIAALGAADERVRGVRLSRNFGQEAATCAGYSVSEGQWIVTMDCDLQDRPEDIPVLYEAALQGNEVVRAVRTKSGVGYRRLGTRLYFALMNRVGQTHIDWREAAFGIIHAKVRDAYLGVGDMHRNMLMVLDWLGYTTVRVPVSYDERHAGDSAYSLMALIRYASAGVFFHTTAPLRWIVILGFLQAFVGGVLAAWLVVERLAQDTVYPGWSSLAVLILMVGGSTIVTIGVAGLYLGKVFDQSRGRPRYLISEVTQSLSRGGRVEVSDILGREQPVVTP